MWFLLQSLIVFAVMASNIAWQWTPNAYLAGVIGFIAALLATVGLSNLLLWARKQRRQQPPEQRIRHRR
jgi:F0F1-type ATP synthase assembly protein I